MEDRRFADAPRLISSLVLGGLLMLPGCSSVLTAGTSEAAGIAGAGAANAFTKSAAAATAIGLGVAAGANAGLQYVERRQHRTEQDRIAEAAGALSAGTAGGWSVSHTVPVESDEHGQVAVVRTIAASGLSCKEIVFSVDTMEHGEPQRAFYTATVCLDGAQWKWASAEPATERWGSLQ